MADPFHHRSNFQNKRKAHKVQGKPKPSSNPNKFGRAAPNDNPNQRKFKHCHQFRDIGKAQRKASAKQKRKIHREKLIRTKLKYFGRIPGGTPKIIALIALSPYSNTSKIRKHLLSHCNITDCANNTIIECQAQIGNQSKNQKSNFIIYELTDRSDTFAMLDICKIADIILLVCSPKPQKLSKDSNWNDSVLGLDAKSKLFCSLIKSVGGGSATSIYGLYQPKFYAGLSDLKKNNKAQQCKLEPLIKSTFLKYLQFEFGASNAIQKNIRIFNCYDMVQLFRFMHSIKNYNDSSVVSCEWKQKRPHLLVENVSIGNGNGNEQLVCEGYLRGSVPLNVNRPVHITGFGDYSIDKIEGLVSVRNKNKKKSDSNDSNDEDVMLMNFVNDIIINESDQKQCNEEYETVQLCVGNRDRQDSLAKLGTLDALATQFDQTIITEKELEEIEQERFKRMEKERLEQKGLSDYNLEWITNDSDTNDIDMDLDIDTLDLDKSDTNELSKQKELEREEFEFPDEVEVDAHTRAKDKFAQYRGLKQFYKTKWDKFELLPIEYAQIAQIKDWKKALKLTKLANIIDTESDDTAQDLVDCGKKVRMYIRDVSSEVCNAILHSFGSNKPLIIWSLLEHENKVSVCHYLVQKCHTFDRPIQGLQSYTFDVGFRRFKSQPLFTDNSRANKHLVKKFINDNQFCVASIYGCVTYPPIGVLMFDDSKENNKESAELCCNGHLLSVNAHRLLIKRKVLTGTAYRVQRRRAVIRYMFYNSDDVKYFKPIDLWTKQGLKGKIEEPIGEKGAMKCFFNSNIKQNDTVCLSLYKRVFPVKDETLFNSN